jgi:hypothetical protein
MVVLPVLQIYLANDFLEDGGTRQNLISKAI